MLFNKFIVTTFVLALLSAASDAQETFPIHTATLQDTSTSPIHTTTSQVTSIVWTFSPQTTVPPQTASTERTVPPQVTSTLWSPPAQVMSTPTRVTFTKATPPAQATPPGGKTVAVYSKTDFCLFLPPFCGQGGIAANGHKAISFCTKPLNYRYSSKPFPTDFIRTAHFRSNTQRRWVQVTGRIRREKYCLKGSDQGGQNDRWHPSGAKCAGYPYFVELVEPNENIYCIRCCMLASDCPTNRDTEGCRAVIRGDYS